MPALRIFGQLWSVTEVHIKLFSKKILKLVLNNIYIYIYISHSNMYTCVNIYHDDANGNVGSHMVIFLQLKKYLNQYVCTRKQLPSLSL